MAEEEKKEGEESAGLDSMPGSTQGDEPTLEQTASGPEAETPTNATAGPGTLDADGDELFVEMSAEEEKLAEANDRYVRLLADFDNYRKRVRKEREILRQSANDEIVLDLLPVIDNLERAVTAGKGGNSEMDSSDSVLKGVELTLKLFANVLSRYGIERIECVGKAFNPNQHEAVAQIESEDAAPDTVVEEILPGYSMNGRVVRASKVNVAKSKPPAGESGREE